MSISGVESKLDQNFPEGMDSFLKRASNFELEMRVLNKLKSMHAACSHSGTYTDGITSKIREYDILATINKEIKNFIYARLYLAVECKNFSSDTFLVGYCLESQYNDTSHSIVIKSPEIEFFNYYFTQYYKINKITSIFEYSGNSSVYHGIPVCKSLSKIIRKKPHSKDQGPEYKEDRSGESAFQQLSQPLSSIQSLISNAVDDIEEGLNSNRSTNILAFLPITVVPDDSLYIVRYDKDGKKTDNLMKTNHISYFVDRKYRWCSDANLTIGRLDIVTESYLQKFIETNLGSDTLFKNSIFVNRHLLKSFSEEYKNSLSYEMQQFQGDLH